MPIYEYVCQKCKHHLEIMQKMSDKPLTRCPECRGKLEKVFSQTSFQFKGSGWYITDYARKGTSESSGASDESSSSDGGSEPAGTKKKKKKDKDKEKAGSTK